MGSCVPVRDIPRFIALYQQGKLPVDRMISQRIGFDQLNEGFDRLQDGGHGAPDAGAARVLARMAISIARQKVHCRTTSACWWPSCNATLLELTPPEFVFHMTVEQMAEACPPSSSPARMA